jgi:enoyl-CoA hydratase
MRPGLSVGTDSELVWQVTAEHVIHLGYPAPSLSGGLLADDAGHVPASAVVFSTPYMILLMERAARKVIEPYLEPGEVSVGASVNIEHMAGTPLGAEVRGVARVTAVDGRSIQFDVAAYDAREQIGRGTHRRAVVRVDRIAERMAEKAGAISAAPASLDWLNSVGSIPLAASTGQTMGPAAPNHNSTDMTTDTLPTTRTIAISIDGAVATVTLNRPGKLNAVNVQMTEDWERVNAYLARHPEIRIVIVTGAGESFCAGDDVPEVGTLALPDAQSLSYRQARVYLSWEQLPQLFIGAIRGSAMGAGCVAACACDLRIAAHGSKFGMPEILLGWPPGYGVAQLTALVGKSRALEMCLTGEPIGAQKALEYGLVHRITASGALMTDARKWADQLLKLPAAALRETKRLVHADEGLQPKTTFVADTAAYIRCLQQPDAREGIAAFSEKRKPRFSQG